MYNLRLNNNQKQLITGCLIIICILIIYWPVQHYGFMNFDDDIYVTENIHVSSGLTRESITWALKTQDAGFWHPLTWLSLMLDYEIYRHNAGGYHWTNVLLHMFSSILVLLVLNRMTGAVFKSGFVALLFALHPLHIESVAWIAERKDVLSAFFWMLTMWFYVLYTEKPGFGRYSLVVAAFVLGLMAKPMLVTLPFVLLLLDCWPLNRINSDQNSNGQSSFAYLSHLLLSKKIGWLIMEKVPMFFLALGSSLITFRAEMRFGALDLNEYMPLGDRLGNAIISYFRYILKTIWPSDLSVYYPMSANWPLWKPAAGALLLLVMILAALKSLRKYPYLAVGLFWYLGTLVPVIGIIQVGSHAFADRYTYIPLIGLFIIMSWGIPDLLRKSAYKIYVLTASFCLCIALCIFVSSIQIEYWKDGIALFQQSIRSVGGHSILYNNLGNALARKGRLQEAAVQYNNAVLLQPGYAEAYNNLGMVSSLRGDDREAVKFYKKALHFRSAFVKAHFNMGVSYVALGQLDDAVYHYKEAIKIKPDFVAAYNNIGIVYSMKKDYASAIISYQKALQLYPGFDIAKSNLRIAQQEQTIKTSK